MVLAAGPLAVGARHEEGEAEDQEHQHLFHGGPPVGPGQKPSGIRPNEKAAVSAMPVVMAEARARITAICMAITPSSAMFGAFRGWRDLVGSIDQEWPGRQTDDRNRREVSDEKRCHRYLQHYSSASLEGCCKNRRKAVPYVTTDDTHCLFPAVRKAASIQVGSRDIREFPDPSQSLAFLPKL